MDGSSLLSMGVLCMYMITIFLGSLGGIFGAVRALKDGAPNPGPAIAAVGFGLVALVAMWESLLQLLSTTEIGVETLQWLFRASVIFDLVATAVVLAGVALLRPGAKPAEGA